MWFFWSTMNNEAFDSTYRGPLHVAISPLDGPFSVAPNLPACPTSSNALDSAGNGYAFLKNLQAPLAGEYGGPMFRLLGMVIASYITEAAFQKEERLEMVRYLLNPAHPEDGGWGIHVGGVSTVLKYTSLRLPGVDADHPAAIKARTILLKLDSPNRAPIYIHPGRWWIHTRMIFLPMSYLYRVRFQAQTTPLILALRKEGTLEACPFSPLQRRALDRAHELGQYEDENTMNILCRMHAEGRESDAVARHLATLGDVMLLMCDGMLVTGINGSQLWDTAFAAQALVGTGLGAEEENKASTMKMLEWLDEAKLQKNPKHHHTAYRQVSKGAWAFSTKEQGYTLTDCIGEGLEAVLYLQIRQRLVSDARIFNAVNLLVSMQCSDGGFGSYEVTRAPQFLESFNAAEGEHTYPECTTSVITALRIFQQYYPAHRKKDIEYMPFPRRTFDEAIKYLHGEQPPDGSWYGSWGICFTHATMFALESLALAGERYTSSALDGGWGESYKSCEEETYVHHEQSQVVQTSWVAMALMCARYPDTALIKRAVALVRSRQRSDGQWVQETIEGIFNKTCIMLIFTVWILGLAHKYIEGKE
ncbi:terpene synthase [Mycena vulgaris]|nr:terpene synthase [Mycena vulgaris]